MQDPSFTERLAEWSFTGGTRITILRSSDMGLQNTLNLLKAHLKAPDAIIMLQGWQWDEQDANTLATTLPTMPELKIGIVMGGTLTDERLDMVMRMGPCLRGLAVDRWGLRSSRHAATAMEWVYLCVGDTWTPDMFARLPYVKKPLTLRVSGLTIPASAGSKVRVVHPRLTRAHVTKYRLLHMSAHACLCTYSRG